MAGRRVLITGVSSHLGGRLAQVLERDRDVDAIIGVDVDDPRHELGRTEFVRARHERRPLERIIAAAAIDTVLDARLVADALVVSPGEIRAVNLTGTEELLAACGEDGSPVRTLVFKSAASVYGWGADRPAFLAEDDPVRPRTALERAIAAAEAAVEDFAARRRQCRVAIVRLADTVGDEARTSLNTLLSLPVIPSMLGVDPRLQVIHAEDVVRALAHVARAELRGVYNAAADGVLVLSEVAALLDKPVLPALPPWGSTLAAAQLRRLRLRVPVELLGQLRFGRGLDNRRLKASGFAFSYTTREALLKLRQDRRPQLGAGSYRYDSDLEEFLRWSPSVLAARRWAEDAGAPLTGYDALATGELVDLIRSLEPEALEGLRRYEAEHQRRPAVLDALDSTLARRRG